MTPDVGPEMYGDLIVTPASLGSPTGSPTFGPPAAAPTRSICGASRSRSIPARAKSCPRGILAACSLPVATVERHGARPALRYTGPTPISSSEPGSWAARRCQLK